MTCNDHCIIFLVRLKAGSSTVERFVRNATSTPPGAPVELRARSLAKRKHEVPNSPVVHGQPMTATSEQAQVCIRVLVRMASMQEEFVLAAFARTEMA